MVALPLFDVVLSTDRETHRPVKMAEELIQSALGELAHIERLDESLAPSDPREFDRQKVALLREMYDQWARSTEALLERLAQLESRRGSIPGAETLRDAHGRTRAMLSIPLEQLERGHRDAVGGRTAQLLRIKSIGLHAQIGT